jgi:hypothetical protein
MRIYLMNPKLENDTLGLRLISSIKQKSESTGHYDNKIVCDASVGDLNESREHLLYENLMTTIEMTVSHVCNELMCSACVARVLQSLLDSLISRSLE